MMKRLLAPWSLGVNAARHLAWYVSYQVSGETRPRGQGSLRRLSRCPREFRGRDAGLPLVLDAECADLRALRLGGVELRSGRVEDADEPHRLAGLDAEGDDVLDLEVDRLADLDAVAQPV